MKALCCKVVSDLVINIVMFFSIIYSVGTIFNAFIFTYMI